MVLCLMDNVNINNRPFIKVHSASACTSCPTNGRNFCNNRLCTIDNT